MNVNEQRSSVVRGLFQIMSTIQRVQGMQDILPEDWRYWNYVLDKGHELARLYGFERLDVPIIEKHELFERGIGETADFFVQKEMYTLQEEKGAITLRPEFTAGVMRAYIQNGMGSLPNPVKVYLIGPIFRREQPQAGRYRQHHQFNCEILGETDPAADVEVMMLAMNLYRELGYEGLSFDLNSTGCKACRPAYVDKLRDYLGQYVDKLGETDQERLARNPLRVLDSKDETIQIILEDAPHLADNLCDDCATHFEDVQTMLKTLGAPYSINFRIVRGMDYYEKTVFEVLVQGIGAQSAVCGGGRYNLAPEIGGSDLPGVGFGSGIERIILGLKDAGVEPPAATVPQVMLVHFGGETKIAAMKLTFELRAAGIGTRLAFAREKRSMKSQMREANSRNVAYTLIIGESELENDEVVVRPMEKGEEQITVGRAKLVDWLQSAL